MSGALWALAAGAGFGVFQSLNRQAVRGMDVYVATFVQLAVSSVVLIIISLATDDVTLLLHAPGQAIFYFVLAGAFHFLIGWTFLNASQKKIGASRTSPLIGTNPVFAVIIAAITLGEIPTWLELVGVLVIVFGAIMVSRESIDPATNTSKPQSFSAMVESSWMGVSAGMFWAISPIFIKLGLLGLPSPILGVTVGVTASAIGYGIFLMIQRGQLFSKDISREAWTYKLIAGVLVGLSTWMRWVALDLTAVGVVLALSMISTPLVIILSPLISGKHLERVTLTLWAGTGLILGGALLLIII